jgi:hypothetical protein
MLKILFFGDVCGKPGRKALRRILPDLLKDETPDLVVANVENLAHGKGITVKTLEELMLAGVNAFTSGNHVFSKKEFSDAAFHKYSDLIVRPANIPDGYPGKIAITVKTNKGTVLLGNFLGQVFMEKQFREPIQSPFEVAEKWLADFDPKKYAASIVDFHCEATSEKIAFGYFLEGRVSAMFGTHTHVPTADARVLAGKTAYITDVGMCGAAESVLGVKKELSLERFLKGNRVAFDIPEDVSKAVIGYVIIEVDENTGNALGIRSFNKKVAI